MTCNNPKLDLVNINAYIKFGEILSICSKRNFQNLSTQQGSIREYGQKSNIAPFFKAGYKYKHILQGGAWGTIEAKEM